MKVLVDTSVWLLAFRKNDKTEQEMEIVNTLSDLIRSLHVVMIGPIRQEILCGISDKAKFEDLKTKWAIFTDWPIETDDYETAAQFYNECRKHGIQGSHIDYLICAVAVNNNLTIFTLDNDFKNYQKYIDIHLAKTLP
jgi:predicted nucleic acid-binding protein